MTVSTHCVRRNGKLICAILVQYQHNYPLRLNANAEYQVCDLGIIKCPFD